MQKGLSLEIKRVIDVIFRCFEFILVTGKNIPENITGPDLFDLIPYGGKNLLYFLV